jgi:uncharacterized glyoxalase superfamily protein PhnB
MPRSTIIPVLEYEHVPKAIDWLCKSFQFTERWRVGEHRAQLSFEGGTIVVTGQHTSIKNTQTLLVRTSDIESHYENARKQGVHILQPPADFPYGERQYTAEDLNGHIWTFSQSIKDLAPEDWGGISHKLD